VTLRARRGSPYLRAEAPFAALVRAIARASRESFRVVHFSVQPDHVHLIVEASDKGTLSSGARGLAIRLARRLNGAIGRRGALWGDRWNGRDLTTPREVRNALVYVLANRVKHVRDLAGSVDALSSAPWFDGFADVAPAHLAALRAASGVDPPVRAARTWLGSVGWRARGLVGASEAPQRTNTAKTTRTTR
jgi:REP element-mobilizing transposase RayT